MRYGRLVRRRALALSVVLVLLAVSGAASARGQAAERPAGELRDCGSRGEARSPQRPAPAGGVRIGPLVLWPSIRTPQHPEPSGAEWPYVLKAPVILPARTKAVLAIAAGAQGVAGFQHRGTYVSAIRFEACREREPAFSYAGTVGKLTGFPFAIGLKRRSACVPMQLWIDGREQPLRRVVPVGRRFC